MHSKIYADYTVSITELKRNPQALINYVKGDPIAQLNHNRPTAYIVPAETYMLLGSQLTQSMSGFLKV